MTRALPTTACIFLGLVVAAAGGVRAGDGDLDPTWGNGGVGVGLMGHRVEAAIATGVGDAAFFGADLFDPTGMNATWPLPPGIGQWFGCCGWEFDVPFLERFEPRAAFVDRAGRVLFAGAIGLFPQGATDRAFVARTNASNDGSPIGPFDDSFAGVGWTFFDDAPHCDTESCRFVDIDETDSGSPRYVLLLERTVGGLLADYFLVGLEESGALASGYGDGGYRQVAAANLGPTFGVGAFLAVDAAGRSYVLHGHFDAQDSGDFDVGLSRFDALGDLDTTYGSGGTWFVDADESPAVAHSPADLTIGPAGEIAAAWNRLTAPEAGVLRIFASGAAGAPTVVNSLVATWMRTIAFDGLGRVLLGRDFHEIDGFRIDRFLVDFGSGIVPDTTFGLNGGTFLDVDAPGGNGDDDVVALVVEGADFYVYLDADGSPEAEEHVVVPVRFEGALLFADSFEWGGTRFWSRTGP